MLFVFLGMIYGVVSALGSLVGGDGSKTAADSTVAAPPASAPLDGSAIDPAVSSVQPVAVDLTSTTTTTIPDTNTVPTAADPARVLLLGDSEAGGLAPFLQPALEGTGIIKMDLDYKVSSGLVRPDFFDWPARLREQMSAVKPDIVIALFGGNDGQGFLSPSIPSVDSPEWRAEYAKRVAEVIDIVAVDGRTLIWVGIPNAEDEKFTQRLLIQNEVVKAELAKHPEVLFVDAWSHFTGIDGGFAPNAIDPRDGESKAVRSKTDGFHLNRTGEEILTVYVGDAVRSALRDRGAAI